MHGMSQIIEDRISGRGKPDDLPGEDIPLFVPDGLAEQVMSSTGNQFASMLISVLSHRYQHRLKTLSGSQEKWLVDFTDRNTSHHWLSKPPSARHLSSYNLVGLCCHQEGQVPQGVLSWFSRD